jgi:hypothetical protein
MGFSVLSGLGHQQLKLMLGMGTADMLEEGSLLPFVLESKPLLFLYMSMVQRRPLVVVTSMSWTSRNGPIEITVVDILLISFL